MLYMMLSMIRPKHPIDIMLSLCAVCTAPKENFIVQNATVGEIDSVKPEDS